MSRGKEATSAAKRLICGSASGSPERCVFTRQNALASPTLGFLFSILSYVIVSTIIRLGDIREMIAISQLYHNVYHDDILL